MTRFLLSILLTMWGFALPAQILDFPSNATLQMEEVSALDSYAMPINVWKNGIMPTELVEGEMTQQAWRIDAQSLTTLQLLRPFREQLRNARYQIMFECQTEQCGGFDFRFGSPTLPPPEMQINLGDFRYLAAWRFGDDGAEYISLFVSRTDVAGFVQITRVAPPSDDLDTLATSSAPIARGIGTVDGALSLQMENVGRAVLNDLTFEIGSSQLGAGPFGSLQALADYLAAQPDQKVALVGHTDSAGSLEANIALSKQRAASVLERLVADYGVDRQQMEAEGMGYLAPLATNLTEEGREANRRVEVIIVSTR
ncbi:OmpA family protein [Yoonia sediminilitoris]|uniref:OOP family OmpA-OmpF porin n=1 Tax=Yoonia sediminilitoris TaxID=1286148 RepID=A0A2T6KIK9_9RHOB|nr:OmpA family protein [Yoonia sediminilitoris]PUB15553.1 OOP family OmpA-OmpF porin [Yoonia sediminilitoris]RCW96162.1 OOP family OmpA-OmpF porin [Yoonia sediminilitoris]